MKTSTKYRIVFDQEGKVYYSNAPFFTLKNECHIGDYLPLFSDVKSYEEIARNPLHPYEFSVEGQDYYVDFDLKKTYKNDELYYDLSINNRTKLYKNLQQERTEKNSYKIKFEEQNELAKRLKARLLDMEDMMTYALGNEMKSSIGNSKNFIKLIQKGGMDTEKASKMFDMIVSELDNAESLIDAFADVNTVANYASFEECYYCGISEIVECVKNSMLKSTENLEFKMDCHDDYTYFVNKFHISNILINALEAVTSRYDDMPNEMSISSTIEAGQGSQLGFYVILKYNTSEDELFKQLSVVNQKKSDIKLLKAKKLIELYGGNIQLVDMDQSLRRVEVTFDNLLFKTIS